VTLFGPFLIASVLLVVAGVGKALAPDDTARALVTLAGSGPRAPGLRGTRRAVRVGATGEAVLGTLAVAAPRPITAALVGLSYLGFAAVVAQARRRGGPLASCGCLGRPDTPPTMVHLGLNLVLAAAALAVALGAPGHGTVVDVLAHQPWSGLPLLLGVAVGTWLAVLAMSGLARLEAARRLVQPGAAG
jgi:hypothetical protein